MLSPHITEQLENSLKEMYAKPEFRQAFAAQGEREVRRWTALIGIAVWGKPINSFEQLVRALAASSVECCRLTHACLTGNLPVFQQYFMNRILARQAGGREAKRFEQEDRRTYLDLLAEKIRPMLTHRSDSDPGLHQMLRGPLAIDNLPLGLSPQEVGNRRLKLEIETASHLFEVTAAAFGCRKREVNKVAVFAKDQDGFMALMRLGFRYLYAEHTATRTAKPANSGQVQKSFVLGRSQQATTVLGRPKLPLFVLPGQKTDVVFL